MIRVSKDITYNMETKIAISVPPNYPSKEIDEAGKLLGMEFMLRTQGILRVRRASRSTLPSPL